MQHKQIIGREAHYVASYQAGVFRARVNAAIIFFEFIPVLLCQSVAKNLMK